MPPYDIETWERYQHNILFPGLDVTFEHFGKVKGSLVFTFSCVFGLWINN